jgi:ElaB/YqjD/DUF883 family membrane-anchored ribosome-binding protein
MANTRKRLAKKAARLQHDVQGINGTAWDAAQERLGQMGEQASEHIAEGREKAYGVACACEHFIRERPLTSLLMAAGFGWLLGRFWKRR